MAVGDLLVSVRASSQAYSNDIKSIQRSTNELTQTTDSISTSWGKSGQAADAAIQKMNRISTQKAAVKEFTSTTDGLVKSFSNAGAATEEFGKRSEGSTREAQLALKQLGRMFDIEIPRALEHLIAESATLGPALNAAFSSVALLGFIQIAMQLPALFTKIKEAVTGWDEAAQKAFENQLELNKQYLKVLHDVESQQISNMRMLGAIGSAEETKEQISLITRETTEKLKLVAALQNELTKRQALESEQARLAPSGVFISLPAGQSAKELTENLKKAQDEANKLGVELQKLQNVQLPKAFAEDEVKRLEAEAEALAKQGQKDKEAADEARKNAAERLKNAQEYAAFWLKALEDFRNRGAAGGEAVADGLRVADAQVKQIIKDMDDLNKLEQQAGDELIKNQQFWESELQKIRNRPESVADQVKAGEEAADRTAKAIIEANDKANKEIAKRYNDTFRDLKDAAGHVFDLIIQGDISGIFKAVSLTWARDLYSNMIANFLTPLKIAMDKALSGVGGKGFLGNLGEGLKGITTNLGNLLKDSLSSLIAGGITSAISAGIGKLVDVIGGAFGKGRKEADRFVQAIQNPFGDSVGNLIKSLTQAQAMGKLTVDQVTEARFNLNDLWDEFQAAAAKAKFNVGKQAVDFFTPIMEQWKEQLAQMAEAAKQQEILNAATKAFEELWDKLIAPAGNVAPLESALEDVNNSAASTGQVLNAIGDDILRIGDAIRSSIAAGGLDTMPPFIKGLYDIANAQRRLTQINDQLGDTVRDAAYWQKRYDDIVQESANNYEQITNKRESLENEIARLEEQNFNRIDDFVQKRKGLEQQIRDTSNNIEKSRLEGIISTTGDLKTYYRAQQQLADLNAKLQQQEVEDQRQHLAELQAQLDQLGQQQADAEKAAADAADHIAQLRLQLVDVIKAQVAAEEAYANASVAAQQVIEAEKGRIAALENERDHLMAFFQAADLVNNSLEKSIALLNEFGLATSLQGIRSFQTGTDYVPKTGLYMLHQGEAVIPKGGDTTHSIYAPISISINGPGDPDAIANAVRREIQNVGTRPPTRQLGVRSNRY